MSLRPTISRPPRSDAGLVVLHGLVVLASTALLVTGIAIAADHPDRQWLRAFEAVLPAGDVWSIHLWAGVVLISVATAYPAYLRATGAKRRIAFDRMRLRALRCPGKARRAALNVAVYWLGFFLLLLQLSTGILLYLGWGGQTVTLHYAGALGLCAFVVIHVSAQFAYGRSRQLLRIVRPGPVTLPSVEPSLADLVRLSVEKAARQPPTDRSARLHLHPLTVGGLCLVVGSVAAVSLDNTGRPTLRIEAIEQADAPQLDGDIDDPVWRLATPVTVETNHGVNFSGTGSTSVTIRAVHDGTMAYLAFTWSDPTRSLKHLPLVKKEDGWHLAHTRYDVEDENAYYEDKFAVLLAEQPKVPAGGSIHLGRQPLSDKPTALSGRGLHYTTDGSIVDVWHWKATRGGLLGYVDDNYFGGPVDPKPAESAGQSRYKAGYRTDPGKAFYANNFAHQPPAGYAGSLQPKRLPLNFAFQKNAMARIDLDPDKSETGEARWWMTAEESQPYSVEADALIPIGTVIPGILIAGAYTGDRADIRCAARWHAGRWTLELSRRLDTGSANDVALRTGVAMWVAAFDHTQTRHTRHMRPVTLEVVQ